MGSQALGQLYQYRFILHEDEKMLDVATDMDINIEGEIKFPVATNTLFKSNFTVIIQHIYIYFKQFFII